MALQKDHNDAPAVKKQKIKYNILAVNAGIMYNGNNFLPSGAPRILANPIALIVLRYPKP